MNNKSCCIEDCNSSSSREQDRGVTFHRLPKESNLRQAWANQGRLHDKLEVNADDENGKHTLYICSRHFRKIDFELKVDKTSKFVLKSGAIPTIFPWGITSLEDLPKIYPDVNFNAEQSEKIDIKTESAGKGSCVEFKKCEDKVKNELVIQAGVATPSILSPIGMDKIKEEYGASTDTETDKETEGNLVIDESGSLQPEIVVKKRKRQAVFKPLMKRTRKPKVMFGSGNTKNISITKLARGNLQQIGSAEENVPGKRKKRGRKKKDLTMSNIHEDSTVRGSVKIKELNLKVNRSPMLRALIEKPNVPMVHPKAPRSLVDTPELNKEKKFSSGNEKSLLVPGALVEAKDFSEQWYSAKIVEVDHDEKEVLIHYDNWSQRYDEWISMASSRLRLVGPPQGCPRVPATPVTYSQGERCMAGWSDDRRFPATVLAVYPNDKYKIQFDDGFVRVKKWQHLTKGHISQETAKQFSPLPYGSRSAPALPLPPSTPPPPPLHNHLFDPHRDHLGSKEERRNKKRKLNVKELFSSRGKRRRLNQAGSEMVVKKRFRRKNKTEEPTPILESADQPQPQVSPKPTPKEEITVPPVQEQTEKPSDIPPKEPELSIIQTDTVKEQTEVVSAPVEQPIVSESNHLKQLLAGTSTPPTPKPRPISDETNNTLKQQLLSKIKTTVKKQRPKPSSPPFVSFADKQKEAATTQCLPIQPEDLARLLKDEWSCKWVDGRPVGEVTVLPPLERGTRAGAGDDETGTGGRLERITVKVDDYRLPPQWTKFLTRRCVGISSGKWDVVLMCPQGRRYRTKAEINARLLESDGPSLLPYIKCLQDFSVHRKLARRLGWDSSSFEAPETISVDALKMKTKIPKSKSSKSDYKPTKTPKYKTLESFTKFKKTSHNSKLSKLKLKKKLYADAISKERMKLKMKLPVSAMPSNSPNLDTGGGTGVISTPAELSTATPSHLSQPVLEEGFIYVGSLKVQIIGTLLRCPKEGCYKNFRKDNLLQMHIKHYHPEMIDLLGSTPNVADLAYARTIVENVTPIKSAEKPHRVREKKSSLAATPKLEPDPLVLDLNVPSENTSEPTYAAELTPKKEIISSEVLEQSPKLRNLLLEPKAESPFKSQPHDVEDMLKTFKIKQENGSGSIIKFKPEKNSSAIKPAKTKFPKAAKSDKELTKSQVMALINKIAEGGGEDRSRSQSPAEKREDKTKVFEGKAESSHASSFHYPLKTKKKRKRLPEDSDADFKPSSGSRKKKKLSRFFHAPKAPCFKSSAPPLPAGSVVDSSSRSTPLTEIAPQKMEPAPSELKQDDNQTFINDNGEKIKIVHMKREEIINCYCGFGEEDGLMIQCELCLCWQHAMCHGIEKESQVPDKYICHICLYPPRGRKSQRYINNQDWLYEGRLCRVEHQLNAPDPNVLNGVAPLSAADQSRAQALKKSHQLCGNLLHVAKILHSLRCKIDVSQKKDHPKLYLWSKPWDDKAQPVDSTHSHEEEHVKQEGPHTISHSIGEQGQHNTDMMGASGDFLDGQATDEMMDSHMVGPYSDITIDEVKLEVGESIEVSEVNEMDDNVITNVHHMEEQAGLLSSPGGTPIHLPITHMELKTLVKSVQVCAPQPEAAIDPSECRQRLLQHIENIQMLVDARLDSIEAQIAELESQDPSLADDETPESYPRTKQTMQMLIRDLQTLEELGAVA